jgi:hypothetical protein
MNRIISGTLLSAFMACCFGACTANVENPSVDQTGRTGDTCTKTCDDTKVTCVAKCTDDACKATCETDHSKCTSSCSPDGG